MLWSCFGVRLCTAGQPPKERGYTAAVGSCKGRAVSLVMIVALAGTPAVAAACAALCMPATTHSGSTGLADKADRHAAHGATPAVASQEKHESGAHAPGHQHLLATENEPPRDASDEGAGIVAAASDRSCCTSDDGVLTASLAAVRADPGAGLATTAALPTPFHSLIRLSSEPKYSPPIVQSSPMRIPLVLRV